MAEVDPSMLAMAMTRDGVAVGAMETVALILLPIAVEEEADMEVTVVGTVDAIRTEETHRLLLPLPQHQLLRLFRKTSQKRPRVRN